MENTTVATQEKRYSDNDVADLLGVSWMTVRRLREAGKLGYYRVGRRIFIGEHHLVEMFAKSERYGKHERQR